MKEFQAIIRHLVEGASADSVLATLVTVEGSSYRRPGARLVLTAEGRRIGSISGGCLEEDVLARARVVAETGRAELVTYDTTSENDLVWGVGLGCHGVVRVLLERVAAKPAWASAVANNLQRGQPSELAVVWGAADPALLGTSLADGPAGEGVFLDPVQAPPRLVIFGAGDDAQPLVRLAKEIGWRVTVADPRPAFATPERFPFADGIVAAPADELVARTAPGPQALTVVMTHHYVHDVPVLRDLLGLSLAYLGLLGPRQRAERILADLARGGLTVAPDMLARLHAPVGLDLGGETPEQVALSIIAEIQAGLAGRDGRPLKDENSRFMDKPALRFGCIILAAGASTRMGAPKQLLPIAGQPLVIRAVEAALASPAWPVVVVLGAHAEKIRPILARHPVLVVENAAWAEGMAASLRTGITTLIQFSRALDGALVALCDQPAFSAGTIARLVATQNSTGRSIAAARYQGRLGAPALFLREHFSGLLALTGEEGARTLLQGAAGSVAAVDLPELATDLDTPGDLAAFQGASTL